MIMNIIMTRLQRFGRFRQLHTIISQEYVKPSSPTPPQLKTHNLSLVDHFAPSLHMPFIFFYKNYTHGDANILKKSLSQTLTSYYPFAGRFSATHVDCNDEGVEFLEASNDSRLDDVILRNDQGETLEELIPNALRETSTSMLKVQLNHFACGGAAVTLSISHKVADGFTMTSFINHWASVTRGETSPKNPTFLTSLKTYNFKVPEFDFKGTDKVKYATRRFVFPNSKLNELKNKVVITELGATPTRVETCSSLIFKCAMDAATKLSGSMKPSSMYHIMNMRKKLIKCPEIAAGNICMIVAAKMAAEDYSGDQMIKLNEVIGKLRKEIMEIKQVRDVDEVGEMFAKKVSTLKDDQSRTYNFSSLCRFPFYEVDFGCGKPVQVIHQVTGVLDGNIVYLMDTPSGDGIEAAVHLEEEEMDIFKQDKELLAYTQDI